MKIKDNYVLQEIVDECIVVPVGEETDKFHGVIKLNGSGCFLWKALSQTQTVDGIINAMMAEYNVDKDAAREDVEQFLAKLKEIGCIEE